MKKFAFIFSLNVLILFLGSLALAKQVGPTTEIDLDKELKVFKGLNAFDQPKNKSQLKPLALLKVHQAQREFTECYQAGMGLLPTSEIKGWLATTALQCLQAAPENKKKSADLKKMVALISGLKLEQGPWKASFAEAWTLAMTQLLEDSNLPIAQEKILQNWAKHWELLSKDQQSAWMSASCINLRKL